MTLNKLVVGIPLAIDVFNKELEKTNLSDFQKKIIQECFAMGLTSGILLELRKQLEE